MPLDEEVQKAKAKLVEQAGRAMVRGAIDDLTLSPEEKAARAAQKAKGDKVRLIKLILGGTGVVVAGIVVMKLLAALWLYGIALVVLAGLGGAGFLVARPKIAAFKQQWQLKSSEGAKENERAAQERAVEDQKRAAAKKLEDDLARLKKSV